MDVLSIVLDRLKLRGTADFRCEARAPWSLPVGVAPSALFHLVAQGQCWLHRGDSGEKVSLDAGDMLIVMRNVPHTLSSDSDELAVTSPAPQIPIPGALDELVRIGGEGRETVVLCGRFEFDPDGPRSLVDALPDVIHIRRTGERDRRALMELVRHMIDEALSPGPGSALIINRLSEALFARVLRHHAEQHERPGQLLASLADRSIARVLAAVHAQPSVPWTLESLASLAGQSRSVFASRFRESLGTTPMQYVAESRIELGRQLLLQGTLSVAQVAERTGYADEAAFSKAFKRLVGVGPGRYRRRAPVT